MTTVASASSSLQVTAQSGAGCDDLEAKGPNLVRGVSAVAVWMMAATYPLALVEAALGLLERMNLDRAWTQNLGEAFLGLDPQPRVRKISAFDPGPGWSRAE